ncbi:MAG: HutD/Ves family protein [Candidatus Nanopelagicales bacterium]
MTAHDNTVLRHRDREPGPWANGGGITYEVLRSPAGAMDFDWRLSVAEVASEGPFSSLPGIDRILVLLQGRMTLVIDGTAYDVPPFQPLAFPGEAQVTSELPHGPTMDVNVMTRRGRVTADIAMLGGPEVTIECFAATAVAAFVLEGAWQLVGESEPLDAWDCVIVDHQAHLRGDGLLARMTFGAAVS